MHLSCKVTYPNNPILKEDDINRSLLRMAHQILERNSGSRGLAIVGIRTRGEHLAERLAGLIESLEGTTVARGVVDIALYRDDAAHDTNMPILRSTELPFHVEKVSIILVDDVLFTGRTIRAALDAIIDFGRPRNVQLAVLLDRGHQELPIKADYVGRKIATNRNDTVSVRLKETDGEDAIFVYAGTHPPAHTHS